MYRMNLWQARFMSIGLMLLLAALGLWRLSLGEPFWLVPLGIVGFVEWLMFREVV